MSQLNETVKSFDITGIDRIMNAAASEDALKILIAAKGGIGNSSRVIKELGLTQKRYYARLKELVKAGLVEKHDDIYSLTSMGIICYNMGEVFNKALKNRISLDLVDTIRKTKYMSLEDSKQILQELTSKGIIGTIGVTDFIQPIKMLDSYESLVSELICRVDVAEKNIYLASHYIDAKVTEALLKAVDRQVNLSVLTGLKGNWSEKIQIFRMILNPKIAKDVVDFMTKDEIKVKNAEFPFSFSVIDGKYIIIELPNPLTHEFYMGFSMQNEIISQSLIKNFSALYESGKEESIVALLKKGHLF